MKTALIKLSNRPGGLLGPPGAHAFMMRTKRKGKA